MAGENTRIGTPGGPEPGHGRNKGSRNRSTLARELLQAKLSLDLFPMDDTHKAAIKEIMKAFGWGENNEGEMFMLINQFMQSLKNDPKSKLGFDSVMDSGYGKPVQPTQIVQPEGPEYDYEKLTEDERNRVAILSAELNSILAKAEVRQSDEGTE